MLRSSHTIEAYICDAARTPIGRYGGALSGVRADDLAAEPLRALVLRNPSVDWAAVDDVIFGCANQAGEDNRNVARMATLLAGLPERVPATTINRLCGSGMDAIGQAARAVRTGEAELVVAAGIESMSRAPFVMPKADGAFSRRAEIYDTTLGWRFVNSLLAKQYGIESMPETAENVAREYHVSREDQDAFAARSQQRAAAAQRSGRFVDEIVAVRVRTEKGAVTVVDCDEHIRAETTAQTLALLPAPFRTNGTVTAGNSSGLSDGACATVVASQAAAERYGLTPKARIVGMAVAGVPPRIMGIGPLPATHKLLTRLGLEIDAIDIVELNEAFAAQALAVLRGLHVPDDAERVNPNGGAIALGHPLGMSGARLIATAAYELQRRGGRYALCTMCIGVGQGIAMLLEGV